MNIISHRGYWKTQLEKNTTIAFQRAFKLAFGTETDIRDFNQELVIAHDMASATDILFTSFLSQASSLSHDNPLILALNIKADGLASPMKKALDLYPNLDCFVFDMSVPDMRSYFDVGIPVFTRMSEVEHQPVWLEQSSGVWLDGFKSEWYDNMLINQFIDTGKRVCVVSPELHHRSYEACWKNLKLLCGNKNLILCTDYPEQAAAFFLKSEKGIG